MGWFDEQIRQRKVSDQELFEDAVARMASAIASGVPAGGQSAHIVTRDAIDDILKFYHHRPVEIPDTVKDPEDQLQWALRPYGLMSRDVTLKGKWWQDACGPMLLYRKEDGMPVAVFPRQFGGYRYRDAQGHDVKVNAARAAAFEPEAVCFYRPLPAREIGIPDLIRYMRSGINTADIVLFLLLTLLMTLVSMLTPQITRLLTSFVLTSGSRMLLVATAVYMLCIAISSRFVEAARMLYLHRIETKISLEVEAAVTMRLMNLPASFFKKFGVGDLVMRSQSVSELCSIFVGQVFSQTILSLTSLLYVVQIFRFAPGLVVPALLVLAATFLVTMITTIVQSRVNKQLLEAQAREESMTLSLLDGVQKIRLAGAEKRAFARWARCYAEEAEVAYDPPFLLKSGPALTLAVSLIGTAVLYYQAVQTGVSPSEYIAFSASYGLVMGAFSALTGIAMTAARIKPILEMTEPILKTVPEGSESREQLTRLSGGIEINNLWFRYHENMPYVVRGMDLKIHPGEYVAIVGRTGCGKSTLLRLLLGFEKPERGAVYYDGRELSRIDLSSLRRQIGTVLQHGGLFQGDIYSNIVICAPHLGMDAAWEAAETAGIADDIREMPMGMHTVIGEGAGGISGGQKQRLMIARAIAPKPKILMFDEATSALDNKTQKQVAEALDNLKCTRIVIAHRLSTIRNCDRILVLDEGRIAEEGNYEELIARNGLFANLVKRQRLDVQEAE